MMFAFLNRFASGLLREGLGSMPEKYVAREKRKIAEASPPDPFTPQIPKQRPAISVPTAITRSAPPPYRWTYPLTFTPAPLAPANIPAPAMEQPKRIPGPYASPLLRRNPWLPKACIYMGGAAYWLPGEEHGSTISSACGFRRTMLRSCFLASSSRPAISFAHSRTWRCCRTKLFTLRRK